METERQIRASKWTGDFGIWGRLAEKYLYYENKGRKCGHALRPGEWDKEQTFELQNGDWNQLNKLYHETIFFLGGGKGEE